MLVEKDKPFEKETVTLTTPGFCELELSSPVLEIVAIDVEVPEISEIEKTAEPGLLLPIVVE